MSPSFFLSRSRSLSPFFSLTFAGLQPDFLFFSVFLLLYIPNLWTCWTMNLSWILIASVSALQDSDGYAIFRQNNFELQLGCHICWLIYFTLVCLWCGRTVAWAGDRSVYGHVITKFSRMGRLLHFLTHGAPLARFVHESPAIFGRNWSKYNDLSGASGSIIQLRQITDLWDAYKSWYFVITEFKLLSFDHQICFFNEFLWEAKLSAISMQERSLEE